ncbi:hypothetical protein [Yoonia maricola]|nr:hypothetical protein [Yoonia maricola]
MRQRRLLWRVAGGFGVVPHIHNMKDLTAAWIGSIASSEAPAS